MKALIKRGMLGGLALSLIVFVANPARAAKWADTASGLDLVITEVHVIFDASGVPTSLMIYGKNLDNGKMLVVTLGGNDPANELTVSSSSADMIEAQMPPNFQPGDYILYVKTGNAVRQYDAYPLTIGAVGPQGLRGEQGIQGEPGPQGEPGIDGIPCWDLNGNRTCDLAAEDKNGDLVCDILDCQGPPGQQGEKGDKGDKGDTGLTGEAGADGSDGAPGTPGADGKDGISCWDQNGNGSCDVATEDVNGSGTCDALDCQGPQGPPGEPGGATAIFVAQSCPEGAFVVGVTAEGEIVCSDGTIGGGFCGNGRLEAAEECDDGNTSPGDGCSPSCTIEICGNGILDSGEECDDGNVVSGDFCSSTCVCEVFAAILSVSPTTIEEFLPPPSIRINIMDDDTFANQASGPGNDTVLVTVRSNKGDVEDFVLSESTTDEGFFTIVITDLQTTGPVTSGDGIVQYSDTLIGSTISVEYIDPVDCQGNVDDTRIRLITIVMEEG